MLPAIWMALNWRKRKGIEIGDRCDRELAACVETGSLTVEAL
jgi:hypothetical protein